MNDIATSLNLPPVRQIGFVYRDLEAAIAQLGPVFGKFEVLEFGEMEWTYRGKPEMSEIRIAIAVHKELEIEIIQWVAGATPHREFIDAGREGMHHLQFSVGNMEEKIAQAEPLGYRPIWQKRFGEGLAAVYLERDQDPLLLELYENHQIYKP